MKNNYAVAPMPLQILRECLADDPRPSKGIMAEAKLPGLSEQTLRTAKNVVGIKSVFGQKAPWREAIHHPNGSTSG